MIGALEAALRAGGDDARAGARVLGALDACDAFAALRRAAADPALDQDVRLQAYRVLLRREDDPAAPTRALLLEPLADLAEGPHILKNIAVHGLGDLRYANADTAAALRSILFADARPEGWDADRWNVVQRQALEALLKTRPLDEIEELVLDRRVRTHPYYPVRVHAAVAIGVLRIGSRTAFDTLLGYLVDDDPQDKNRHVRKNAWISLAMITRETQGLEIDPTVMANADDESIRWELTRASSTRAGVGIDASRALDEIAGNDEKMAAIRAKFAANPPPK